MAVVDRIARLLAIVAESGREGCRLRDLVERSALNRATAYRLVDNLRRHGFLRQGADGKTYHLGLQLLSLGAMAGSHEGLREIARPCLMRLAAEYSDTFFLFVRDGYENVCIDIRDGRYPVRSYTRGIGGRVPLGVGQAGLAVLAFLEDDDREEVLSRNRGNLESNFAVRVETLPDFAEIRARGYVSDTGSCMIPEYTGVGAPIFDSNGQPVAA
ncbi:kipR, partial [Symbiodinium necroappetens]